MAGKRTILIVDDSLINRQILSRILSDNYLVHECANGQEAFDWLSENAATVSAVLLDIMMPVMDGYGFLSLRANDPMLSTIPVIVTTQLEGDQSEIHALTAGASDFLTKPYNPAIVSHRLANIIHLREAAQTINTLERDPLTNLYNQKTFEIKVEELISLGISPEGYDIISIDIERFKLVNDLFNLRTGNLLLVAMGAYINESMWDSEAIVSRYSGDKFIIACRHNKEENDKYITGIQEWLNNYPLAISMSIYSGIYHVLPNEKIDVNSMVDRCELAAETIKGSFGTHIAYYDDKIRAVLLQEQNISDKMRPALTNGQFQAFFQPKVDFSTGKITGAEALVRWIDPEKGVVSPADFIPVFERNGFITEMDHYIWEHACILLRKWIDMGYKPFPVSVNVSRVDIYNVGLADALSALTAKYGLDNSLLHIEITESAYVDSTSDIISTVNELRSRGFHIEMDDFGSGYSSLNMLSEMPVDTLKIDMQFLHNRSLKSDIILNHVVALAKDFKLSTVAEGVETEEQAKFLKDLGCNLGQGFLYSKPVTHDEFTRLLDQRGIS